MRRTENMKRFDKWTKELNRMEKELAKSQGKFDRLLVTVLKAVHTLEKEGVLEVGISEITDENYKIIENKVNELRDESDIYTKVEGMSESKRIKLINAYFKISNFDAEYENNKKVIAYYEEKISDLKKELEAVEFSEKEKEMYSVIENEKTLKGNMDQIILDTQIPELDEWLNTYKEMLVSWFEKNDVLVKESEIERLVEEQKKQIIMRAYPLVGVIKKLELAKVGDDGSFNGVVSGEYGTCKIETILAGGYNIQRLHFRVLVHKY